VITTVSASVAKARLSEWIQRTMLGEIVLITRHGKLVAALVPPEYLEQLQRLRRAGPQAGLVSVAGGWSGSDELAESLGQIERTAPRSQPDGEHS